MFDPQGITDFRMLWIKNKILSLLGIKNPDAWMKMIARNNLYVYKNLMNFIECDCTADGLSTQGIFLVFKSTYPKRHKKEVIYKKLGMF